MRWRVIEMRDVGFGYQGGAELLSGMTLSLQPGMFHFLTGPSGSGKTTLLRLCYADLIPTAGQMNAFGQDLRGLDRDGIANLRRRVGVVHQDPQFLDHLPLAENVALPLTVAGEPVDMDALRDLLGWVQLAARPRAAPLAVRGRAAAGGAGAGGDLVAGPGAGRRADGQSGLGDVDAAHAAADRAEQIGQDRAGRHP